jgi:hypothetical protein
MQSPQPTHFDLSIVDLFTACAEAKTNRHSSSRHPKDSIVFFMRGSLGSVGELYTRLAYIITRTEPYPALPG